MAPPSDETERRNWLTRCFFKFRDECRDAAKREMLVSILESFETVESSEASRRDTITDRFMQQLSQADDPLLQKKLDAAESFLKALDSKYMCGEYLEELAAFCKAEWPELVSKKVSPQLPEVRYIDRLEEKLRILQEISVQEICSQNPEDPPRRIDPTSITANVWSAFWAATVEELQHFLEFKVRSGRFFVETIETAFIAVDAGVPKVMEYVMNKRGAGASSKTASSKAATSNANSTNAQSGHSQSGKGKEKERQRNPVSIEETKQREGLECPLLHTIVTEGAHIYPVAKIEYVGDCTTYLKALDFIWGGATCNRLKAALGVKDLDIPSNMIALDHAPHHLWDLGKVTFNPVLRLPKRIDLEFLILEPLDFGKSGKRKTPGNDFPEGLATDPRTKVKVPDNTKTKTSMKAAKVSEIRFVSAQTQHRIRHGHRFTITSNDPKLLPSADLLDLRNRVMVMMALKGGAEVLDDVLSSASGDEDAPRVLVGAGDVEMDLDDKVLGWSEHAEEELALLTTEEANQMPWRPPVIEHPAETGDTVSPKSQTSSTRGDG
ncbi:hypothetical protein GQ607_014879 [Colletotrichum asianum]|uniref:HNH nuclease domain-containing protein n=1 Tax=Colletotrichum asianum TaxID=702518 RepID=A0A8H3W1N3_9PEZI|nr:hypothetical protein GQ607_014879 [Colletotrichum asianum]